MDLLVARRKIRLSSAITPLLALLCAYSTFIFADSISVSPTAQTGTSSAISSQEPNTNADNTSKSKNSKTIQFAPKSETLALPLVELSPEAQAFILANPVIRVAIPNISFSPFQYLDDNGDVAGISISFLQSLANMIGVRIEPVLFDSWPSLLQGMKDHHADMVAHIGYTSARAQFMNFTPGVFPKPNGLMGLINDDQIVGNPSIKDLRVAVGRGFIAESNLAMQFPEAIPVPVEGISQAIAALRNGTVDLYFGEMIPAMEISQSLPGVAIEVKQRIYFGSGWTHFAVRKDWSVFVDELRRLIGLHRDAVIDTLSERLDNSTLTQFRALPLSEIEMNLLQRYPTLRVSALHNDPLLNNLDEHNVHSGIAADINSYIMHQLALPVSVIGFDTEADMMDSLINEEIDLIPLLAPTQERRKRMNFSEHYFEMSYVLVGQRDTQPVSSLEEFSGKTLALSNSHALLPSIVDNHPDIKLLIVSNNRQAIQSVLNGEADATIELSLPANYQINTSTEPKIQILGRLEEPSAQFSFAMNAQSAELLPVINRVLSSMDDSVKHRLIRRWIATDSVPIRELKKQIHMLIPTLMALTILTGLIVIWNRHIAAQNKRRLQVEKRLVDMTECLRTGVYQFRQPAEPGPPLIEFANSRTYHMARVKTGDLIDADWRFFDYVHAEDRERIRQGFVSSFKSGDPINQAFRFQFPNGKHGWVLCECTSTLEKDGSRLWSGYLFDLTSERQLLENMNRQLLEKDQFVAFAGHELRSPAQNIALSLDSIETAGMTKKQLASIDMTRSAVHNLSELVDDLLDISSIDAGEITLSYEHANLTDIMTNLDQSFAAAISSNRLSYSSYIDESVPSTIWIDSMRLRQILFNLVSNAIKYTHSGSISVRVTTDKHLNTHGANRLNSATYDSSLQDLVLTVTDTGIGIPADKIGTIFKPFSTIGPSSRHNTGLGLTICKRLVDIMNGRIQVDSTLGKGSTFTVSIPVEVNKHKDNELTRQPRHPVRRNSASNSDRVLLVDDDVFTRATLASLLDIIDIEVVQASSGEQALKILKKDKNFTALITDYRMGGMSGTELAQTISCIAGKNGIRPALIAMTGGMSPEDTLMASHVFDSILIKPVNSVQIRKTIDSVCGAPS